MADRDNTTLLLWGGITVSPLGWMFLGIRFLISFLVTTLLVIWDLIATIFTMIWKITTDIYPFLLIVLVVGLVLLLIHIFWHEFVIFLNEIFMPLLQIIVDDFIRFIWNTLFLNLWNIVVQIWDSLVQLIGFFVYFALNLFVTIMQIVVQIIGALDLPAIFADIMEILTPLIQLWMNVAKLFIQVGTKLLQAMIPILMAMLKIYFEYIKIIFQIYGWIIITMFRVLEPILRLVVIVVDVVTSFFGIGASVTARALLSVRGFTPRNLKGTNSQSAPNGFSGFYKSSKSKWGGGMDAGEFVVTELYSAATRYYTENQYQKMYQNLDYIHKGIREEDVFHSQNGYFLEPGASIPDYSHHLYVDEDLDPHERRKTHEGNLPETFGYMSEDDIMADEQKEAEIIEEEEDGERAVFQDKRQLLQWKGIDMSTLSPEELKKLETTRAEFLESLKDESLPSQSVDEEPEIEEEEEEDPYADFVKRFTSYQVKKQDKKAAEKAGPKTKKKNPLHDSADPYAEVHPNDHWRIDYTRNMTHSEVFPNMKGVKLNKVPLHELHPTPTPKQMHEKRKRAVAYVHAIQVAYYKTYKRHISNGHIHKVFSNTLKHLTGHDNLDSWFEKFQQRYVSPAHLLYSIVPSTHDKGFFKYLWRADPDYEKRPPFHVAIEKAFGSQNISQEYWVNLAEFSRLKEEGLAHDETNVEGAYGPQTDVQAKKAIRRRLMADFFGGLQINLEILYEDDCFTTPRRNILCLPFIPMSWQIPYVNFSSVILTSDLNNNPACEPVWKSTSCLLCWAGVWNTIQETRFLIYWLDLISIILIFGIFTPRPSELIGYIGKLVPPLEWVTDLILIYEPGVFPNGQQWACWFENLWYLYEGFLLLLFIYYILDPLWEWFMRTFRAYQALIVVYRMRIMERRQAMELFDEALLGSINSMYTIKSQRAKHNNWNSYAKVNSPMGEEYRIRIEGARRTDSTAEYVDRRRMAEQHQNEILELTRIEMETDSMRREIGRKMDVLAAKIGAQYGRTDQQGAQRKRTSTRIWQFVTSVLQIPFQSTPVYTQQLHRHHRRMHENMAPPGSEAFPSPYESVVGSS